MAEPKIKFQFNLPQHNLAEKQPEQNKTRLYILVGILFILILLAIGVNVFLKNQQEIAIPSAIPDTTGKQMEEDLVQILPQLERKDDTILTSQIDYIKNVSDPFGAPIELLGIITGENDLAILKAQQVSYILSLGDKIADAWELTQINRNSVILKNDTKEIIVELAPRK